MGRTTQGVRIMKIDEGSEIVAMARAIREDQEDEEIESSEAPETEKQEELTIEE